MFDREREAGSATGYTGGRSEPPVSDTGVMTAPSDERLVARCRIGDLDAFAQVYHLYEKRVFRFAYHLLGHRDDADDIKQETFLKAYQAIGRFRGDSSLQTWLLKICGNLCRDRIKSWERRKVNYDSGMHSEIQYDDSPGADPHAVVERTMMSELVMCALRGLPSSQREVIVLHDLEELTYSEIGTILGCSTVSAKLRVFRARRMLRDRVQAMSR